MIAPGLGTQVKVPVVIGNKPIKENVIKRVVGKVQNAYTARRIRGRKCRKIGGK